MEDMKGDMGGDEDVKGMMREMEGRKEKVKEIGVIGMVENMKEGNEKSKGDIVK